MSIGNPITNFQERRSDNIANVSPSYRLHLTKKSGGRILIPLSKASALLSKPQKVIRTGSAVEYLICSIAKLELTS